MRRLLEKRLPGNAVTLDQPRVGVLSNSTRRKKGDSNNIV
ncbi:MAG: hypothetical protein ACI9W2_005220, partial [Gammaproteobacteria bacterium]